MFKNIPTYTRQDIIDKAFRKASKVSVKKGKDWQKNMEIAKVNMACSVASSMLQKTIKRFPSFGSMSPFYNELTGILLDKDMVKKNLGALQWGHERIRKLRHDYIINIKKSKKKQEFMKNRKQCYARLDSFLKQLEPSLLFLADARERLKQLPQVEEDTFTVVIAGFPNVGKSFLLKRLTGADPDIQPYPFTTKGINVGFLPYRHLKIQIIDTPGLFDRPLSERNEIERLAIAALNHLSGIVLFILDESETCGYVLKDQLSLLREIGGIFRDVLIVNNKCDIKSSRKYMNVSAFKGTGIEELKGLIADVYRKAKSAAPILPS